MAASFSELLDCRVEVRDYRLVPKPTRWMQKGERVIVQSPMLEILGSTSFVPSKRCSFGEEQNSVCFLPRDDIDIHYTGTRRCVTAHGVALSGSSRTNQFHFERGHRFWLNIKPETNTSDSVVPVINLDTCEEGTISINQACWYPKVQGPNDELWTLGGDIRKQKLVGSRKFVDWSWVICQRLDGSTPTTKMAEIPTKETECQGTKRLLSSSEARSLFEKRYRTVEKPMAPSVLPSPPLTPLQYSECIQERSRDPDEAQRTRRRSMENTALWRRIFSMAKDGGGSYKCLRRSTIHTQKPLPPLPPRTNDDHASVFDGRTINEDDSDPTSIPTSNSPSIPPPHPLPLRLPPKHPSPELEDASANLVAQHLVEMSQSEAPPLVIDTLELLDNVRDLFGLKCKYIPISTNKHFHCSPSKCVLDASPSDPSLPPHQYPLPDRAARCLLLDKSPGHICCHGNYEDKENWSAALDQRKKGEENEGDLTESEKDAVDILVNLGRKVK